MARPKAKDLTERELELMRQFWDHGEQTIAEVHERLGGDGRKLAYTTVATLVRILVEKDFLKQSSDRRPHRFRPRRSFQDVSGRMLKDLVQRLFGGSREALLVRLMEDRSISESERQTLLRLIEEDFQQAD